MADRHATVTWEGTLTRGHGTIDSGSGALAGAPVTWASRVERADGKTSPEELLAAAQAECYAMVMAHMLTEAGNSPERLEVRATCTVEEQGGGLKITTMKIDLSGVVPNVDQQTFEQMAQQGEQNCPVSNALRGNVQISVQATLQQSAAANA